MERKRTAEVAFYCKVITRDLFCNFNDVTFLRMGRVAQSV